MRIYGSRFYFQDRFRRRLAGPLHRSYRASPHSYGWAPYTVTHSRRKYHHLRMCLMASTLPGTVCDAGVVRSFLPASSLLSGGISPRARRLASHTQNVSDCPIQLCVPDRPLRAVKVRIGAPFLIGAAKDCLKNLTDSIRRSRQAVSGPPKCAAHGSTLRPDGNSKNVRSFSPAFLPSFGDSWQQSQEIRCWSAAFVVWPRQDM